MDTERVPLDAWDRAELTKGGQIIREATGTATGPFNTSGLDPIDKRVLVRKDPAEEKTKGGIILPDAERDKKKFAMTKATVIAVGALAWAEAKHDSQQFGLGFVAPVPGDRVQIGRYTGDNITGADGQEYTIINDTDVIGRLIGE